MRYAYLHGFAADPRSEKGLALADRFQEWDIELRRPDLNHPSFETLTYSGMLEALDELDARTPGDEPWRWIGSSMGGYAAARWAEQHPERVDRLVLLAPGFEMVERWTELLGESGVESWREEGSFLFFDPDDQLKAVHFDLYEDARTHPPYPEVSCETLIVHGTEDDIVPAERSRAYAEARDHVEFVAVEDAHKLHESIDRIAREAARWFGLEE